MAEAMIPPWVTPETPERIRLLDDGTTPFQPAFARGNLQVQIWSDPRWQFIRRYKGMRSDQKAALLNALHEARGKAISIRMTPHAPLRGSFPASELLTNNTFESGTTGWTSGSSEAMSISVTDRVLRCLRGSFVTTTLRRSSAATVTQYAAYAARMFSKGGRGTINHAVTFGSTVGAADYGSSGSVSESGMVTAKGMPFTTDAFLSVSDSASGKIAGDYHDIIYTSLARCMLVDNGPNELVRSAGFDNASWVKARLSATANATAAPDGNTVAESLIEDTTASNTHYITQSITKSALTQDWTGSVFLQAGARTQAYLIVGETNINFARVFIDLSNGTILSGPTVSGTITDPRAFIFDCGNGWYHCFLTARIPASITTTNAFSVGLATGGSSSYTGDGTSNIFAWGGGYAQVAHPHRYGPTVASSVPTGVVQTGGALTVRALPVSMNGLMLAGDWFEINGELKMVTAPLNSDSAGRGNLQFRPALVVPPTDGDPIIIVNPFGRFRLMNGADIDSLFGLYVDTELELTEVYV